MNSIKYFMEKMKYFMETMKYFMDKMKNKSKVPRTTTIFKLVGPSEILSRSKRQNLMEKDTKHYFGMTKCLSGNHLGI